MVFWRQFYSCLLCCCLSFSLWGQYGAGAKLGVDFDYNIPLSNTINIGDSLVLNDLKPEEEGNFGVWFNLGTDRIYFQTELLMFVVQERYQVNFLNTNRTNLIVSEQRLFLEVPFLAGFRLQPFSFYGGISPRLSLNTPKGLSEWFELKRKNKPIYLKYTLGIGLSLGSFKIDFRYNNRLVNYIDEMSINGISTQPINHIERFTLAVGFDLLR